jgi:hypothetical protein
MVEPTQEALYAALLGVLARHDVSPSALLAIMKRNSSAETTYWVVPSYDKKAHLADALSEILGRPFPSRDGAWSLCLAEAMRINTWHSRLTVK